MHTGTWTSKGVKTSHPAWGWEKMNKKMRWMALGVWTTEDSEVHRAASERAGRPVKMVQNFAKVMKDAAKRQENG